MTAQSDNEKVVWLKRRYHEAPSDGPNEKKVKFSKITDELHQQFPERKLASQDVSALVKEAFPSSDSRRATRERVKHVFGIEMCPTAADPSSTSDTTALSASLQKERAKNLELTEKVHAMEARLLQLEKTSPSTYE